MTLKIPAQISCGLQEIMTKILLYSSLLILGLFSSQFLGGIGEDWIKLGTMFCLSFIMIHVGYEFEIDKSQPKQYVWDYIVAGTAATFPWLFCAGYFVWVIGMDSWKEALLVARFSSPTSAGVLFSMLAAAGFICNLDVPEGSGTCNIR